jgi:nitrogen-specific signal transduction histidine kinase/FixJ family two-component response regulator
MKANRRILIVDDQKDLRHQLTRLMQDVPGNTEAGSLIDQIRSRISKGRQDREAPPSRVTFEVDAVGQGRDAYEHVKKSFSRNQPYALMFLDMRMPPGWDGLETAQRIRSIDKEIQIVIMTAYADYEQHELAGKISEPNKLLYLKKPFHPEEIRQLALAMTENWNINRRENDRLILTNRLMRENSRLTRKAYKSLDDTYHSILDAFVAFLDAGSGVMAQRHPESRLEVRASTAPEDAARLMKNLEQRDWDDHKSVTNDADGSGFFPFETDECEACIYVEEKNIVFPFEQLKPFLDILLETSREVLKNSLLLHDKTRGALVLAMRKLVADLENAATSIRNSSRLIRETEEAAVRESLCRSIDESTDAVVDLSMNMLGFCQGQRQELNLSNSAVEAIVAAAVDPFRGRARDGDIALEIKIEPELMLFCDAGSLRRCLSSLIDNAVESLERKKKERHKNIQITAARKSADKNSVVITVRDNGMGVAKEIQGKLFDPFVTDAKTNGNGLGATISKQIAKSHGGDISFSSVPGKGSDFNIELPASHDPPAEE